MQLHTTLTDFIFYADVYYSKHGQELVITSGSELTTRHMRTSLHYSGQAVDIRTKNSKLTPVAQSLRLRDIAKAYCIAYNIPVNWFDIIAENDHLHLEYQPKRPN